MTRLEVADRDRWADNQPIKNVRSVAGVLRTWSTRSPVIIPGIFCLMVVMIPWKLLTIPMGLGIVAPLVYIALRQLGKRHAVPFLLACIMAHALSELWMAFTAPVETLFFRMETAHASAAVQMASALGGAVLGVQPLSYMARLACCLASHSLRAIAFFVIHHRAPTSAALAVLFWTTVPYVLGLIVTMALDRTGLLGVFASLADVLDRSATVLGTYTCTPQPGSAADGSASRFDGSDWSGGTLVSGGASTADAARKRPGVMGGATEGAEDANAEALHDLVHETLHTMRRQSSSASSPAAAVSTPHTSPATRKRPQGLDLELEHGDAEHNPGGSGHVVPQRSGVGSAAEPMREAGLLRRAFDEPRNGGAADGGGSGGGGGGGAGGGGVGSGGAGSGGGVGDWRLPQLMAARRVPVADLDLGKELGLGSFGFVHLATWHAAGAGSRGESGGEAGGGARQVAVKVLHRHQINSVQLDAFSRALQVELGLARHANICGLHGWACDAPRAQLMVVMEVCDGGSLAAALEGGHTRGWPRERVLKVAREVAAGVAFLHSYSPPVVHRDLKPDNLLFDAALTCKICDLGLSRIEDPARTMTDSIGTPIFCAPEQLAHRRYGASADVWAVGCVLVCLSLHTKLPYPKEVIDRDDRLLSRIVSGDAVPSLPASCILHAVASGCCQFDADRRLSAATLEAELARFAAAPTEHGPPRPSRPAAC